MLSSARLFPKAGLVTLQTNGGCTHSYRLPCLSLLLPDCCVVGFARLWQHLPLACPHMLTTHRPLPSSQSTPFRAPHCPI